jgi:hypothetical protein
MLPGREQLGPYDASAGPLGGRHGLLDNRRIIVVPIVHEAEQASFHHPPAIFHYLLCRRFD